MISLKKGLLLGTLFVEIVASTSFAQSLERRSGEMLVQLRPEASPASVLHYLAMRQPPEAALSWKKVIAPRWHIYLLSFDETATHTAALLQAARQHPDIVAAQWNHRVEERATYPNDPDWSRQKGFELIGMPEAWDVATGGLRLGKDTIVVAVLEKGALRTHPDLIPNYWFNWKEIPNNGRDDDDNGYVDDFRGWNPRRNSDNPGSPAFHGTAVNAIIGAKGNNNLGVTGINWNVRLMNLAEITYEDEIVAGYYYAATMRRLYNETNGAKGAFVVATNASFGIDNAWPRDFPLWCAVYDSLGKVGILSVGATANANVNVDLVGDMPSTCPSEYLIVVNNVDQITGRKITETGYGKTHVDLGAPGDGTYTARSEGESPTYGTFNGTSAAAPHVTGTIALLYNLSCPTFIGDALTQPAACARRVRDLLLQSVAPEPSLANITTTGGRLHVANAIRSVQQLCDGTPTGPLEILWLRPNPVTDEVQVRFQTPTYQPYRLRIFNMLGQLIYESDFTPEPFNANIWKHNLAHLPQGVYCLSIGRNDAWRSVKFVKK
ncbi:MAG: S8 family peptidase [Saprospiraceae bacterium]|nr:S8 family peptidase [Saprospiraceae bacterium]MDW8484916.1 S8/S53 family peptidase [Saprospiraceae bacterium]